MVYMKLALVVRRQQAQRWERGEIELTSSRVLLFFLFHSGFASRPHVFRSNDVILPGLRVKRQNIQTDGKNALREAGVRRVCVDFLTVGVLNAGRDKTSLTVEAEGCQTLTGL